MESSAFLHNMHAGSSAHLSNEHQLLPPVSNQWVCAEVSPDLLTRSSILRPLILQEQPLIALKVMLFNRL